MFLDQAGLVATNNLEYQLAGDMTMGALTGMLMGAGIVLLLVTRNRLGAE